MSIFAKLGQTVYRTHHANNLLSRWQRIKNPSVYNGARKYKPINKLRDYCIIKHRLFNGIGCIVLNG